MFLQTSMQNIKRFQWNYSPPVKSPIFINSTQNLQEAMNFLFYTTNTVI